LKNYFVHFFQYLKTIWPQIPADFVSYNLFQTSSVIRRTGEVADGKFRIGEIHESGGYSKSNAGGDKSSAALALLKRSQSTGDIDDDDKNPDVPYIDSDHSCCQEFRKSDCSRKLEASLKRIYTYTFF
jgi:hypothetical protein